MPRPRLPASTSSATSSAARRSTRLPTGSGEASQSSATSISVRENSQSMATANENDKSSTTTLDQNPTPWKHPNELPYVCREDWSQDLLIEYLCQKAFSVPARDINTSLPLVQITARNGTVTSLPRKYRVPLMFVAKFQWESLRLVLNAANPATEWDEFKFDIIHLSRLCQHLFNHANEANKAAGPKGLDKGWRSPMFDRVLTRFYHKWFISREWSIKKFWEEFDEEEYEIDVLKYDWIRWALKGHKGFILTKEEVQQGITADQYMRGLGKNAQGVWTWTSDAREESTTAPLPASAVEAITNITPSYNTVEVKQEHLERNGSALTMPKPMGLQTRSASGSSKPAVVGEKRPRENDEEPSISKPPIKRTKLKGPFHWAAWKGGNEPWHRRQAQMRQARMEAKVLEAARESPRGQPEERSSSSEEEDAADTYTTRAAIPSNTTVDRKTRSSHGPNKTEKTKASASPSVSIKITPDADTKKSPTKKTAKTGLALAPSAGSTSAPGTRRVSLLIKPSVRPQASPKATPENAAARPWISPVARLAGPSVETKVASSPVSANATAAAASASTTSLASLKLPSSGRVSENGIAASTARGIALTSSTTASVTTTAQAADASTNASASPRVTDSETIIDPGTVTKMKLDPDDKPIPTPRNLPSLESYIPRSSPLTPSPVTSFGNIGRASSELRSMSVEPLGPSRHSSAASLGSAPHSPFASLGSSRHSSVESLGSPRDWPFASLGSSRHSSVESLGSARHSPFASLGPSRNQSVDSMNTPSRSSSPFLPFHTHATEVSCAPETVLSKSPPSAVLATPATSSTPGALFLPRHTQSPSGDEDARSSAGSSAHAGEIPPVDVAPNMATRPSTTVLFMFQYEEAQEALKRLKSADATPTDEVESVDDYQDEVESVDDYQDEEVDSIATTGDDEVEVNSVEGEVPLMESQAAAGVSGGEMKDAMAEDGEVVREVEGVEDLSETTAVTKDLVVDIVDTLPPMEEPVVQTSSATAQVVHDAASDTVVAQNATQGLDVPTTDAVEVSKANRKDGGTEMVTTQTANDFSTAIQPESCWMDLFGFKSSRPLKAPIVEKPEEPLPDAGGDRMDIDERPPPQPPIMDVHGSSEPSGELLILHDIHTCMDGQEAILQTIEEHFSKESVLPKSRTSAEKEFLTTVVPSTARGLQVVDPDRRLESVAVQTDRYNEVRGPNVRWRPLSPDATMVDVTSAPPMGIDPQEGVKTEVSSAHSTRGKSVTNAMTSMMRNIADLMECAAGDGISVKGKEREVNAGEVERTVVPYGSPVVSALLEEFKSMKEELRRNQQQSQEELENMALLYRTEVKSVKDEMRVREDKGKTELEIIRLRHREEVESLRDAIRFIEKDKEKAAELDGEARAPPLELLELRRRVTSLESQSRSDVLTPERSASRASMDAGKMAEPSFTRRSGHHPLSHLMGSDFEQESSVSSPVPLPSPVGEGSTPKAGTPAYSDRHPFLGRSLDGMDFDGSIPLPIKSQRKFHGLAFPRPSIG